MATLSYDGWASDPLQVGTYWLRDLRARTYGGNVLSFSNQPELGILIEEEPTDPASVSGIRFTN